METIPEGTEEKSEGTKNNLEGTEDKPEGTPKASKGWTEDRRKKQSEYAKKLVAEGKAFRKAGEKTGENAGEIPEDEEGLPDDSHFTYYLSLGLIVLLGLIGAAMYLIKTGTIKIQPKE